MRGQRTTVWVVLLAVVVLFSGAGCTRRYFVNPAHLPRALATADAHVPALTNDREPTFILASAIRRQELADVSGLLAVRARDARTFLRTTGWIATAIGAVFGTVAVSFLGNDDPGSLESELLFAFGIDAIVNLAIGVPFLVVGYTSTGAEEEGPSPGMPLRLTDP